MRQPTTDELMVLVSKWRADGEYWSGTEEDAAFQKCADELLRVMDATDADRLVFDLNARDTE